MVQSERMPPSQTRDRILSALAAGPLTTMELCDAIQTTPSMRAAGIRHTLKAMTDLGLVRVVERRRRQGTPMVVWGLA